MLPRRNSAATPRAAAVVARVVAAAAAAAPMTAAAVEQLIEERVSAALANHETLQNSNNGHGNGSHNSDTGIRGTVRTPFKYCPRGEIKKLDIEIRNLKVNGTDIPSYTLCFQELALMCGRMFPEESDEVEKYVGGLPDMIRGNVMQAEHKRKLEYNAGNNQGTNNKTRDRTLGGLTPLGLVKRGSTRDHCPCVQNATITTKVHVLPGVISARRSIIWLVTAEVLVPMETITIVGTSGQLRMLSLVMSMVFWGTSRKTTRS
ncbi:hypothetical protein Tco_0103732 [Tanacetum coccineum]